MTTATKTTGNLSKVFSTENQHVRVLLKLFPKLLQLTQEEA